MSSSPSPASLSSTPGDGSPTVPILIRSTGLDAPAPQVSLIPQISASGIPRAWKNTSTSRGVGAAPTLTSFASSSPIAWRSDLKNSSGSGSGVGSPACSASTRALAAAISCRACSLPASLASSPALSFSHTRGTAKNQVGLTAGRNSPIRRGSGQVVIVMP